MIKVSIIKIIQGIIIGLIFINPMTYQLLTVRSERAFFENIIVAIFFTSFSLIPMIVFYVLNKEYKVKNNLNYNLILYYVITTFLLFVLYSSRPYVFIDPKGKLFTGMELVSVAVNIVLITIVNNYFKNKKTNKKQDEFTNVEDLAFMVGVLIPFLYLSYSKMIIIFTN